MHCERPGSCAVPARASPPRREPSGLARSAYAARTGAAIATAQTASAPVAGTASLRATIASSPLTARKAPRAAPAAAHSARTSCLGRAGGRRDTEPRQRRPARSVRRSRISQRRRRQCAASPQITAAERDRVPRVDERPQQRERSQPRRRVQVEHLDAGEVFAGLRSECGEVGVEPAAGGDQRNRPHQRADQRRPRRSRSAPRRSRGQCDRSARRPAAAA